MDAQGSGATQGPECWTLEKYLKSNLMHYSRENDLHQIQDLAPGDKYININMFKVFTVHLLLFRAKLLYSNF